MTTRVNKTITVTAGTAIRVTDTPAIAVQIFFQMVNGGSGEGFVFMGIPNGVTPVYTDADHVTAELAPASVGAPGGSFSDAPPDGVDVSQCWVDGSNSGDKIRVSYLIRC